MKFLFIFTLIFHFLYPKEISSTTATMNALYNDKIWLNLLHSNKKKSIIEEKSFFLSKGENPSPKNEMIAAIDAYKTNNINQICRFPARFFWLSKKLEWRNFNNTFKQCTEYNNWELLKNVQSISMVFVSGFLGNPASAFGHSFLKINKKSKSNSNLSDISVGYGAKLPKQYGIFSYLYNGIFGEYRGSYTHKYYFMDELTYSNKEFREIWEYQLKLDKDKMNLLLMHLWELKKVTFGYYFFNKNCGFKMSELLEVISDKKILDSGLVWYAPIETFYKLESITDKVTYYPSLQQKIYAFYQGLLSKEKNILDKILLEDRPIQIIDNILPTVLKIKILDFLVEFYTYELQQLDRNSIEYNIIRKKKNSVLQKRVKLPVTNYKRMLPPHKRRITFNNKPRKITTILETSNDNNKIKFGFSPFSIDDLGYNLSFGDNFSILDTEISLDKNKLIFSKMDIIKIKRLQSEQLPFDIDNSLSWKLHIGMQKIQKKDYFAKLGLGYSWKYSNNFIAYSMIDFSLHTNNTRYRISPYIGFFVDTNTFKLNIEYGKENSFTNVIKDDKLNMRLQYNTTSEYGYFIELKKEEKQEFMHMGIKWYF